VYDFVFVPYESSIIHFCRLLCITALILLLIVVSDPSKSDELYNNNLRFCSRKCVTVLETCRYICCMLHDLGMKSIVIVHRDTGSLDSAVSVVTRLWTGQCGV